LFVLAAMKCRQLSRLCPVALPPLRKACLFSCRSLSFSRPCNAPRDAYAVLGLQRSASNEEVKARFRELAKKNHPDLNTGDRGASMKMAELTSAYDTLTDPRKRAALDHAAASGPSSSEWTGAGQGQGKGEEWVSPSQMYSEFQDIFGRTGAQRTQGSMASAATRGEDISAQIDVAFLDAVNGCEQIVSLVAKQSCMDCRGTGAREGTGWSTCRVCKGSGVQRVERGILSMGVPCHVCKGVGEVLDHPCPTCRGEGIRAQPRDVRVVVPAGIRDRTELRIPGAGHSGTRGGKSGHLFVTVRVLPHRRFRRIEDDVVLDVGLTLRQALLGGEVLVPSLHGTQEKLRVDAPTQPGSSKVLRGRGPPRLGGEGRGDIVFHFVLQLPKKLSSRQVSLIEEFDSLCKPEREERQEERAGKGFASSRTGPARQASRETSQRGRRARAF